MIGQKRGSRTVQVLNDMDAVFGKYISAKFAEALVVGIFCYIGLALLNVPYALLWSVVLAIFNMVPFFGPWISTALVVGVTMFQDPAKALWVLVFLLIVQAIDGWIIAPRIFGQRMNLKPIWVLFGVVVGGALFGVMGLFLGVPVLALFKVLFQRITRVRAFRARRSGGNGEDGSAEDA